MRVSLLCHLILTLAFLSGCAAPWHFDRDFVSANLGERTGHGLNHPVPAFETTVPDFINWHDGITEDEAVTLALWNNAAFQQLLTDLDLTRADLIAANQLDNPSVATMFPVGTKQFELALTVPLDVLLLRPQRVAAAQLESNRVAERLVQDGLNLIRDVRQAHADLLLAQQRLQLAEEGAHMRRQVSRVAEARLRAGDVSALDISAVRIEALLGDEAAARAIHDVELARQRLRTLMGVEFTDIEIEPLAPSTATECEFNIEELVNEALTMRPDLRAIELAVAAADRRARLARFDYLNIRGILPDINSDGEKGFEAGPGAQLNIPLFHQNQGARARAEALVEQQRRNYVTRRDAIALEVQQAYTQYEQAREDLQTWREQIVPETQAAFTRAQKALEEDRVSLLLVLETTRQLLTAHDRELAVAADLQRAVAELERSVGRRLFDAAPREPDDEELPLPPLPDAMMLLEEDAL